MWKAALCDELLCAGGLGDPVGPSDPILVVQETSSSRTHTANAGAGRFAHKDGGRPQRVQPSSSEAEENTLMSSLPIGGALPYESIQLEDLCEVCHKRPKFREIKLHAYCGSTCAPKLPGVPGAIPTPVPPPKKPPKPLSQIPGSSSTVPVPDTTVLSLADAASLAKVRDLFVNSWQPSSPEDVPQVAAVLSVKLAEKYEKRFTTAMTQGVGTRTTFTTFFGGQCVCNLAAPVSQISQPCYMTTCVICSVLRSSFGSVGLGDTWLKGPHGDGVYTSSTPSMAHRFTVGQAKIPFRPMIVCDVTIVEDPTAQGNVIFDNNGQIVCKKKDNILPKFVVIYQPPPEIEIINSARGLTETPDVFAS
ncbi:hypothetical protein FRB99_003766, partial [Tulasnella sp. 403]